MINVAAIRMQQFGVQFYQASLTASDIDKLVRFEVLNYGEQRPAGPRQAPQGAAAAEQGQLGPARAPHRLEREGLPAAHHPQEDRRARPVLRAVPPGARPAVDSRRGDHLLRRGAQVRAGRSRMRPSALLKVPEREGSCARSTASTGCWRCTPTSSASATSRSPCRRSSSIACRKITSCRCSSRSTPSTPGSTRRISCRSPAVSSIATKASPRRTTSSAR